MATISQLNIGGTLYDINAVSSNETSLLKNYGGRIVSPSAMMADGKMRLYLSTSSMTTDKPPTGDGHILHFG